MRGRDLECLQWLIYFFGFAALLICSSVLNLGCSSQEPGAGPMNLPVQPFSSEPSPQPAEQLPEASFAWTVKIVNGCDDNASSSCTGRYPFFVFDDHSYQVGPGPDGQVVSGRLGDAEFKMVNEKVGRFLADGIQAQENAPCEGSMQLQVQKAGVENCYSLSAQEPDATEETTMPNPREALQRELSGVAKKYYPVPFPNTCINAAWALEKMIIPMKECKKDLDCGYIDENYDVVQERAKYIETDDCSLIKPLVVANVFELVGQQRELLFARESAREACKASPLKTNCKAKRGFNTEGTSPLCIAGTCRVHPSREKK